MATILHKADSRGVANHGWLNSRHTFSFANYHNPERLHFGMLRVLNDDIIAGGTGFGRHPHDNMEIISIPISGALAHKDSTGRDAIIRQGEVQIMSAGSGIQHSEHNASQTEPANFLQIWVLPKERNITPRYDQKLFDVSERTNNWQTVVAPDNEDALWINQDSWFSLSHLQTGKTLDYTLHGDKFGAYLFVIKGDVTVNGQQLNTRDAIGLTDTGNVTVQADSDADLLLIEVPMR